jgi:hypothetical protein
MISGSLLDWKRLIRGELLTKALKWYKNIILFYNKLRRNQ